MLAFYFNGVYTQVIVKSYSERVVVVRYLRARAKLLHLYIKARSAATTARGQWIVNNLELRANQFHREIDLAALQEVQRGLVEYDAGVVVFGPHGGIFAGVLKDGILFADNSGEIGGVLLGYRDEAHEVLKAVTAAAFDLDAQSKIRVLVLDHDFRKSLWHVSFFFRIAAHEGPMRCYSVESDVLLPHERLSPASCRCHPRP